MSKKISDEIEYTKYPYEHHHKKSKPVDNSKSMKMIKNEINKNMEKLNLAIKTHNGKYPPKTMTNRQLEEIFDEVNKNIKDLIDKQKRLFLIDVETEPIRKSKHSKKVGFHSSTIDKGGKRKTQKKRKSKSFFSMFK